MYIVGEWQSKDSFAPYANASFEDWWELIGYLNASCDISQYAHCFNDKDVYRVFNWEWNYVNGYYQRWPKEVSYYPKKLVAVECTSVKKGDYRIINLSEIQKSLKIYKPRPHKRPRSAWMRPKVFEFRNGPVPWTGHSKRGFRCRRVHSYIRTWSKNFLEIDECEFHLNGKGRASDRLRGASNWDWPPRDWRNDGWKAQGKRKKQWQRN